MCLYYIHRMSGEQKVSASWDKLGRLRSSVLAGNLTTLLEKPSLCSASIRMPWASWKLFKIWIINQNNN